MMVWVKNTKIWTIGDQTGIKGWPKTTPKQGILSGKQGQQPRNRGSKQIFTIVVWNFNPNINVMF
jgi:hypothetical protein